MRLDPSLARRGLGWAWRRAAGRYPRLTALRAALSRGYVAGSRKGGLYPGNVVWIFGSGRSGSTWLRSMMGELDHHKVWEEPMVGRLFGEFYDKAQKGNLGRSDFIMGTPIRAGWMGSIRNFVLDGAQYSHPLLSSSHYLVVKEPNGSLGAPLLMEAVPESRMILLVRDPRDVVASVLDGAREGNWLHSWTDKGAWRKGAVADNDPDAFVRNRATVYLQQAGSAKKAYDAHGGRKVLVRYEDLISDTLGTMKRIYSTLEVPFEETELVHAVEKHSWTNIPENEKGEGKFYRKASPGGWREDLTPAQARTVENITGPLLGEFYPDKEDANRANTIEGS